MKKPFAVTVVAAFLAVVIGGCGYRIGSIMHPQIHSIAIAPVTNETAAYNVGPQVRGLLCECFQQDGSLQLKRESNADCILYARVTHIEFKKSSWSSYNDAEKYVPIEWKVTMTIEYSVVIPGDLKPLMPKKNAKGSATFMTGADMEAGRVSGIRQAAFDASKKIVHAVTEGW